jgi:hypothetical protein
VKKVLWHQAPCPSKAAIPCFSNHHGKAAFFIQKPLSMRGKYNPRDDNDKKIAIETSFLSARIILSRLPPAMGVAIVEATMNRQDIYIKTEKGSEEIQNRKNKLSQTMRSLLVMINGSTTVGTFLDQATALGDVTSLLTDLEQQGFIKQTEPAQLPLSEKPAENSPRKVQPGEGGLVDFGHLFTPDEGKKDQKD